MKRIRLIPASAEPGDLVFRRWQLFMRGFYDRSAARRVAVEERGRVCRDMLGGWAVVVRPVSPEVREFFADMLQAGVDATEHLVFRADLQTEPAQGMLF